jgi:hypothetical protein
MNWLKKYRFVIHDKSKEYQFGWIDPCMNYLCGQNLSKFKYRYEITEEEFFNSSETNYECLYLEGNFFISPDMVEFDIVELRKRKINQLNGIYL